MEKSKPHPISKFHKANCEVRFPGHNTLKLGTINSTNMTCHELMGADKDGTVHDMIAGNITARDFKFTYVSYSTNFRKTARKRLEDQVHDWADHEIFHNN